ncbi:hypothetical protein Vadar_006415 [Vaccinium darrowii]|uniref:Uncharacterized protein n=1 Tax=Vaccinium darrowii TaxID=229202 RepID=A0ACB7Y6W0_9ERIC|nr:hypothetical protein Vadar_006415 [Vaccinium darrowii]
MSATRLLRSSRPLGLRLPSSPSPSYSTLSKSTSITMNLSRGDNNEREKRISGAEKKVPFGTVKAVAVAERINIVSVPQTKDVGAGAAGGVVDLAWLLRKVSAAALVILKVATKPRPRLLNPQMFIERSVIDCRFFALFAVAGSLLGSVLCFLEGFFLIIESYVYYFNMLSQNSDKGHMVQLLIEAIDMFLVGTALLVFGMSVHVMFVGSNHLKAKSLQLPGSNLFGLFHLKSLPRWACMQSVTQAKSKIGHAIIMILQVGMLEKFKNVPLVTGLDLACFAGAVFISSACVFLLSRLSIGSITSAIKVVNRSPKFSSKTDQ